MTAIIDTLEFADRFEKVGFEQPQARALAAAFASAGEAGREELVTKSFLDIRLGELEARMSKQHGETELRLTRQISEIGNGLSNRLWSTVAIIAGVSTAVSATIGAGVALVLRQGM